MIEAIVFTQLELFVVILTCVMTALLIYRKMKVQRLVLVNCWFCNRAMQVPLANSNSWDCPFCDQYNGLRTDGDYIKPVPAQFTEDFNHPMYCQKAEFLTRGDFLCPSCQRNQLLKVKQLAAFEPLNEATYDEEIDFYKRHLEKVYALCPTCDTYVQRELEVLDDSLNKQQDIYRHVSFPSASCDEDESTRPSSSRTGRAVRWLPTAVTLCISLCSALLLTMGAHSCCLGLAQQAGDGANMSWSHHQRYDHSSDGRVLSLLGTVVGSIDRLPVALCGLLLCLCSKMLHGKHRVLLCDAVHILLWVGMVGVGTWLPPASSPPLLLHLCHLVTPVLMLSLEMFLACRHRPLSTASARVIRRLSLDAGTSGACSDEDSDAVSSVSTSCRRRVPSPFWDSGDGPCVPALSVPVTQLLTTNSTALLHPQPLTTNSTALLHPQPLTTNSSALHSVPGTRTHIAARKDCNLDTLSKGLGAVSIGSLANDSGHSTGRSSVFSSCSFDPVTEPSSASPRPSTPRPLISPAKLSMFSLQPAVSICTWSGSRGMFGGVGMKEVKEGVRSPGQANPFLPDKARPRSMFDCGGPITGFPTTTTTTTNHLFAASRQRTRSCSRSLVLSLDDLKAAQLSLPRTRSQTKAASELGFPLPDVRRRGSTVSEMDFPLLGARKIGKAMSEVDSPVVTGARKFSRTANKDSLQACGVGGTNSMRMSGMELPIHNGYQLRQTVSGVEWRGGTNMLPGRTASGSVGLSQSGVMQTPPRPCTPPLTSWWRDSASDLRHSVDAERQVTTTSQPYFEFIDKDHREHDRDTDMECRQPSFPMECDSTTPLLSQLNISPPSSKKRKRRKKALKEVTAGSVFLLSDDEEEDDDDGRSNQSSVSTIILQSKSEWGWLQWAVVAVLVFSVCTNLFLSWTVWAARH